MRFSFGKKSEIEQSLTISVVADDIEKQVKTKLNSAQKTAKIKGFRKGKAPLDVVKKMYEPEIRQDVINDSVIKKFYELVEQQNLKLVGQPNLTPERLEIGKDILFKATFEVYPEISLGSLSRLSYTKTVSSVTEKDVNKTVENIRKRMSSWESKEEIASSGDQIKINFIGKIDNEEFEGGSAKDFVVEIGSQSMIEGFEEGLVGLKKSDKKDLDLNFPEDYAKKDLASKKVVFSVEVIEVLKPKLPALNEEFFKSTGLVAENLKEFKKEIKTKLQEDLENLIKNKTKASVLDSIREANVFEVPRAMIESEVNNMREDAARRVGMDPKDLKEDLFPKETFEEEAKKRVSVGIILNKIIEEKKIKADGERVRKIIEDRAAMYKEPQQVVNWFYSNEEQLRNVESISLEEQVIEILLSEASMVEEELTYEECVTGKQ
ncbi:MAG: trigger factor [Gammaproteobacteria bacterium]|jgi:trigger factor|nr:MAG: trigger factor [Gammaproteobacteria bacterium]|tara:strand:+ start:239 stop:1543 length:1305 start_codon:yes stop_codon:yes gene_type:complete